MNTKQILDEIASQCDFTSVKQVKVNEKSILLIFEDGSEYAINVMHRKLARRK